MNDFRLPPAIGHQGFLYNLNGTMMDEEFALSVVMDTYKVDEADALSYLRSLEICDDEKLCE